MVNHEIFLMKTSKVCTLHK